MVERVYFDPVNTSDNMYKEEYEWKVSVKKEIDPFVKQKEEKYPCLNMEEEVWDS